MMDRLGLYDSVGEMQGLMDDIVGVHIHETLGLSDHWCPYVHSKDMHFYDAYLPMIRKAQVKVYEQSQPASRMQFMKVMSCWCRSLLG